MRAWKAFAFANLTGMGVAALLGLVKTRYATLHLLEKNKALLAAGRAALPGNGHLETMASWSPALAGALFFALALGFGYASAAFLYGLQWRKIPRRNWTMAAFPFAILPFMALYSNEWDTYLALTVIPTGSVIFAQKVTDPPVFDRKRVINALFCVVILAAGFAPWAASPQGAFVKIRDRLLLGSEILRPVNDFYYKWTLYPAEAIKPVDLLTQPAAAVDDAGAKAFCADAARVGVVCMPKGADTYDFVVKSEGGRLFLAAKNAETQWDSSSPDASRAKLKEFADKLDTARILRRATSYSLGYLAPLALLVILAWLCTKAERKPGMPVFIALTAALLLSLPALPRESDRKRLDLMEGRATPEEVASALAGPDPVDRFYGAFGAGHDASRHKEKLLAALEDPVVNVRYAAAQSLGGAPGDDVTARLKAVLDGTGPWYVKFRAYNALLRLGWQP